MKQRSDMTAKWITSPQFAGLTPINIFHRERQINDIRNDTEHENSVILFRKKITLDKLPQTAELSVTADDLYKLYINGVFVTEGPSPAYHFRYRYDTVDISEYLKTGENTLAFLTYYSGLINRVCQSGDRRHGLCCELVCDGMNFMQSDESFLCKKHTGFTASGKVGYDTQFLQICDSRCDEDGFERPDHDDSRWEKAVFVKNDDHIFADGISKHVVFEKIKPALTEKRNNALFIDFGGVYVGYLCAKAKGKSGEEVIIRCGQELRSDGTVRYNVRANCAYEEKWILSGKEDALYQIDYKSFRYAEIVSDAELYDIYLLSRHYPFELKAEIRPEWDDDTDIKKVFDLCVRSQKYGVQEMVTDCMEREKGVYLGDGCYTSLCNFILTKDDKLMRQFIEDAFASSFISDTLMSCLNCSYMQEIAEYPLILVGLLLWHYRLTKDKEFLQKNAERSAKLLDAYGRYEENGLLYDTHQWCVTEWPGNYRDGYAVNNDGNKPLPEPHVAMNAYYINAIKAQNEMQKMLGLPEYKDVKPLIKEFNKAFYDSEKHLYKDGLTTDHISYIGNAFPFGFGLCDDPVFYEKMTDWFAEKGVTGTSLFATFPLLTGFVRLDRLDLIKEAIKDQKAWLNMVKEGGTATFECWSADGKWNTSLFHLQNTHIATFISDSDLSFIPV